MIDIKALRKNPEEIARKLKESRNYEFDFKQFIELDNKRKELQISLESEKNKNKEKSEELKNIQQKLDVMLSDIPNLPHESVPVGLPDEYIEIKKHGNPKSFDFAIKDHVDIAAKFGLNFNIATELSGARFSFMRGKIARLYRALTHFMLDTHTSRHGYDECYTPYIVN